MIEVERPEGVVVQFGGQTPLRLARGLAEAGVPLLGTSVDAIDRAEDRNRFGALCAELGLRSPPYATAERAAGALEAAERVGYPLLVRPSYVLGGRAMEICYSPEALAAPTCAAWAARAPIYLDRFLENAIEIDVDALCDGRRGAHRRGHAARGGGRRALGRLGLRDPGDEPRARDAAPGRGGHAGASRSPSGWSGSSTSSSPSGATTSST